ncbi:MAG: hypothetical protein JSW03_00715 [Candidatus Eiseniibacteriota bacterium]|nr:MAG: hypothetical protein JSW03_00715 [Candidatus Eisenbacteria bacterium]
MNRALTSLLLTAVVAVVIVADHLLEAPWKFAVWGLGLSLPWIVVSRLASPRLR